MEKKEGTKRGKKRVFDEQPEFADDITEDTFDDMFKVSVGGQAWPIDSVRVLTETGESVPFGSGGVLTNTDAFAFPPALREALDRDAASGVAGSLAHSDGTGSQTAQDAGSLTRPSVPEGDTQTASMQVDSGGLLSTDYHAGRGGVWAGEFSFPEPASSGRSLHPTPVNTIGNCFSRSYASVPAASNREGSPSVDGAVVPPLPPSQRQRSWERRNVVDTARIPTSQPRLESVNQGTAFQMRVQQQETGVPQETLNSMVQHISQF